MSDFVQFGTASGLGLPLLAGGDSGVLTFSAFTLDQALLLLPNTGDADGTLTEWTLALDIFVAAPTSGFMALLQTDTSNASDGEFFIRADSAESGGLGISGSYQGSFSYGEWHRVVVTAEATPDGIVLDKYIDGVSVGSQTLSGTRWNISDAGGTLLLADEDGETNAGALSSVMVAERALTAEEVASLGGADADGIAATPVSAGATQFDFDDGFAASYGAGTLAAPGDTDPPPAPLLQVVNRISDVMKTPGSTVTIDLSEVFNRDDITFTIGNDDATVVTGAVLDGEVLTLDLGALGHADLRITATDSEGHVAQDNFRVRVAGPNAYTLAVLPDTQDYSDANLNNGAPQTFMNMTSWLVDNKDSHGIKFVAHVGDITQNNLVSEWQVVDAALSQLDGIIPYSVLPGNHDQGPGGSASDHTSLLDTYFSPDRQAASNPGTFGGVYDREPDRAVNNYNTFAGTDGTKWLVLSMEFGPRDDVIRWAKEVLDAHLDHRVIIVSHALTDYAGRHDPAGGPLYDEGAGYDYGIGRDPEGANDGETVYRELLAKYPNITFTFSGHIFGDGAETNVSYSQHGNAVIESLVNYQNGIAREITGNGDESLGGKGGNGAIRLVVIDPDNDRISTETYFTEFDDYLDGYRTKEELDRDGLTGPYRGHEEVFTDIDVGTPELRAQAKAGDDLFVSAPNARGVANVTLDARGTLDPANNVVSHIWYDAEGNAIARGELAEIQLGAGRHHLTLAVTDSEGRVTTDEKLILVAGPGNLLTENFNDGSLAGWDRPGASATLIETGAPENFGIAALAGGAESVGFIPKLAPNQGLLLQPNLGQPVGTLVPTWSLIMDILVPSGQGNWTALAQLNPNNVDDGDLFIRVGGNGTGGIGIGGNYQGSFAYDTWQRVGFTFTPNGADTLLLTKYIDGVKVGEQTVAAARFSLDVGAGLSLFTDEDGETSNLYVSSVLVTEKVYTEAEMATLGGAKAGGIEATAPTALSAQFDFNEPTLAPTYGPATLSFGQAGETASNFLVKGTVFAPGTAQAGEAAAEGRVYEMSDSEGNVLLWKDEAALDWHDYTLAATIRSTDNDGIGLVFYWQDADNHYRLVLDGETNTRSLVRVAEGVETALATETGGTRFNVDQELSVAISDGRITAMLDGRLLFGGEVVDATPLTGGTIGLYSDNQRSAQFDNVTVDAYAPPQPEAPVAPPEGPVLVSENFSGAAIPSGWVIVDEGEMGGLGPDGKQSNWAVVDGKLVQRSDLQSRQLEWDGASNPDKWLNGWSPLGDGVNVLRLGTYALYQGAGASEWTDYAIEADIVTPDNDGLGFLIHYKDAHNYYKLELDADGTYDRNPSNGAGPLVNLIRMRDGIEEILAQVPQRYTPGESFHLRFEIVDQKMRAFVNGEEIFAYAVEDRSLTKGTVALYSWGNAGLAFDDVTVTSLVDAPEAFATPEFTLATGSATTTQTAAAHDGRRDMLVYEAAGTNQDDILVATGANDVVIGRGGDDVLDGAGGHDALLGGADADTLRGGEGNDTLNGNAGADEMAGGFGDDVYLVDSLGDAVMEAAGQGRDRVNASVSVTLSDNVEDLLLTAAGLTGTGNEMSNRLIGSAGDDVLLGLAGNDVLQGLGGNDTLEGGAGRDRLQGGAGADLFRFSLAAEAADRIEDFTAADTVQISASGFGGGLVAGMDLVAEGRYLENTTGRADAAFGQFVFETDANRLWWDADGTGAGARQIVADFTTATGWAGSEIAIIA
ncbi:LamG-like jellyroll fold domain-containing protein [Falsiroseomonas sp.]|uniref:LamG-like jellyroll fold domain-containing protein n=1 Tax=Falsiroseomonas sp. TaxID=2870721 RepID=UPI003F708D39